MAKEKKEELREISFSEELADRPGGRGRGGPNFLFIMADQWRFDYLGSLGADFVETPNIDRLAREGVTFENCFTTSPVCAPARISLASGFLPHRLGALNNSAYLPKGVETYYERLRDHGYRMGCVGKLDLAKPDPYNGRHGRRPVVYEWGFTEPEEVEGKMHAGMHDSPQGPYGFYLKEKGLYEDFRKDYKKRAEAGWNLGASHDSVLPEEDFADIYIGRRASEWLKEVPRDFPWHYFVSFVGPHNPFDPPTRYGNLYRNADMPFPIQDELGGKPAWQKDRQVEGEKEEVIHCRRQYCGSITAIDEEIGKMLDVLEERNMLEDTYFIFTSDHGEMLGDHGFFTKTFPYEASMHVPLIMAGPGIKKGETSAALIELHDLNPTICQLAGIRPKENIDARSFVPCLENPEKEGREAAVSVIKNWRSIRTDRYKYVDNLNDLPELYDLRADPDELDNLAPDNDRPKILEKLQSKLSSRLVEGKWLR